jgi:hypothetical protein
LLILRELPNMTWVQLNSMLCVVPLRRAAKLMHPNQLTLP